MLSTYSHIQTLELELERSHKNFSLACEQEESRRLRVDLLFLQDDNADLQAELLEKEDEFDVVHGELDNANAWIEELKKSLDDLGEELQLKLREADKLKTEVHSLQVLSKDSAKILEEKLALAREINTLRPEIEHLRAQQTSNAAVLSEKLTLQRQLQTLQVELENEKRAVQKALIRDEGRSTKDAKLELEIETYKADLAKEKTLRQKLEREGNKTKGQQELDAAAHESKLDEYRTKLKSSKEQILKLKSELGEARKANERLSQQTTRQPQANRGKRNFSQMDADGTIGTPDGFPPKKTAQLLLGEKSGFGLTPFLRQSKKLVIETPKDVSDNEEDVVVETTSEPVSAPLKSVPLQKMKATAGPITKVKPQLSKISKTVGAKVKNPLNDIAEETAEAEMDSENPNTEQVFVEETVETQHKDPVPKKKRRMLGGGQGKTLFDDDDTGDAIARGGLDDFKFSMPKRVTLAPKGVTALAAKGNTKAAFGAFSPLKKDRKR